MNKSNETVLKRVFITEMVIPFDMADPVGILFFGNIYALTHRCFEKFIQFLGFTYDEWFKRDLGAPIRHSEADYYKPLRPGEVFIVEVYLKKVSNGSMVWVYKWLKDKQIHAEVTMVHAFASRQKMEKRPIPEDLKKIIAELEEI